MSEVGWHSGAKNFETLLFSLSADCASGGIFPAGRAVGCPSTAPAAAERASQPLVVGRDRWARREFTPRLIFTKRSAR
jgi:hypothetical protein